MTFFYSCAGSYRYSAREESRNAKQGGMKTIERRTGSGYAARNGRAGHYETDNRHTDVAPHFAGLLVPRSAKLE
jgi:hypothetical protein